jgi:hypothetical protein
MKRPKMSKVSCILVAVLTLAVLSTGTARATSSLNCGGWSIVPSPSPGTISNHLNGVTATSANNVWAVGAYSSSEGSSQTLIEKWNSKSWKLISSPNPSSAYNELYGVGAVSSNDIWAVGITGPNNSGITTPLIEHWDGSNWNVVPGAGPGGGGDYLTAIAVNAANDIWAVGYMYSDNPVTQTFIEHWDGTSWSAVSSPNPGQDNVLYGVTAISTNDVWAVGDYYNTNNSSFQTLIEHWDGSSWSVVSSPNPGSSINYLFGVASIPGTSGHVWAVGNYENTSTNTFQTMIEKWNGKNWKFISSPNVASVDNHLNGVVAVSANNAWTVGYASNTLIQHWNGTSWSVVSAPAGGTLASVTRVPGTKHLWAVGNSSQTLTEFYC